MDTAKKKSHLRKMLGGFRTKQDQLLYLINLVSSDVNCLNDLLDRMDESRKQTILAVLKSK